MKTPTLATRETFPARRYRDGLIDSMTVIEVLVRSQADRARRARWRERLQRLRAALPFPCSQEVR